jgi:transcriptional regulator with XRE-family HTH domain
MTVLSDASTNDSATRLGTRVRALRRERGMTLKTLGRLAGLSHPFLSQLERGLARPSVASVERIAEALGVTVGDLWAPDRPALAARLIRRDAGELAPHDVPGAPGGVRDILTGDGEAVRLREWSGGSRRWPEEATTEPGLVAIYVVRGELEVETGDAVHRLEEGDALRFDGAQPHRLRRTGTPATRALLVLVA